MSVHRKHSGKHPLATPERQITAVELHHPYELRCPHCECLYARFWSDGQEEFLYRRIELFDDWDEVAEREAPDEIYWAAYLQWGKCPQCVKDYLAVEVCGGVEGNSPIFLLAESKGIPKFGVSLGHIPYFYRAAGLAPGTGTVSGTSRSRGRTSVRRVNWIALRTEVDGVPVESHLTGLFPLAEQPAAGWSTDDYVPMNRELTREGYLAAGHRDLLANYYRPFTRVSKGKTACVSSTSGQCAPSIADERGSQR